jgi:hypothetical protein
MKLWRFLLRLAAIVDQCGFEKLPCGTSIFEVMPAGERLSEFSFRSGWAFEKVGNINFILAFK